MDEDLRKIDRQIRNQLTQAESFERRIQLQRTGRQIEIEELELGDIIEVGKKQRSKFQKSRKSTRFQGFKVPVKCIVSHVYSADYFSSKIVEVRVDVLPGNTPYSRPDGLLEKPTKQKPPVKNVLLSRRCVTLVGFENRDSLSK